MGACCGLSPRDRLYNILSLLAILQSALAASTLITRLFGALSPRRLPKRAPHCSPDLHGNHLLQLIDSSRVVYNPPPARSARSWGRAVPGRPAAGRQQNNVAHRPCRGPRPAAVLLGRAASSPPQPKWCTAGQTLWGRRALSGETRGAGRGTGPPFARAAGRAQARPAAHAHGAAASALAHQHRGQPVCTKHIRNRPAYRGAA
jgi:hypothetical protein